MHGWMWSRRMNSDPLILSNNSNRVKRTEQGKAHGKLTSKDVVVACGEMGRSPRVGKPNDGSNASPSGRDHWETGFTLLAGGGLRTGQVIGETDRRGERSKGTPYTPQNVLATLQNVLGIDATTTFPDHSGRPQHLLDDREPIGELL